MKSLHRLNVKALLLVPIAIGMIVVKQAADGAELRPRWDHEEAQRRVRAVIAKEEAKDFAWDNIAWLTSPAEAASRAQQENKPIFLYFFLKGPSGPSEAPC